MIIGIDPGLKGHIVAINEKKEIVYSLPMPTTKKLIEPSKRKKIGYYKNGNPKYKVIRPAKYKTELDIVGFHNLIKKISDNNTIVVIEKQNGIAGNSARSSSTISFNYGQLIASLKILHSLGSVCEIVEVSPQQWKKYYGLLGIKNKKERKNESINKAKELLFEPKTHDEAEAILITHWLLNNKKE